MDLGAPLNDKLLHLLRDRIEPGGAIAAHNAYFFRFEQPAFLAALRSSPNLETSFVPTLSGGISLSVFRK
jgi:predicted O-methyltransferase YrrM